MSDAVSLTMGNSALFFTASSVFLSFSFAASAAFIFFSSSIPCSFPDASVSVISQSLKSDSTFIYFVSVKGDSVHFSCTLPHGLLLFRNRTACLQCTD